MRSPLHIEWDNRLFVSSSFGCLSLFVVPDHSFLASVLAAFCYGSFAGLSQDLPRTKFLSTVPSDAGQRSEMLSQQPLYISSPDIGRRSYRSLAGANVLPSSSLSSPLNTGTEEIPITFPLPRPGLCIYGCYNNVT